MAHHAKGPTVARRRLRIALRAARENANLTQEQAAELLEWSLSKVIRIEAGTVGISSTDLRASLQLYSVTNPTEVQQLLALARVARQRDWLAPYREHLPSAYAAYIGLEREASTLYFYNPLIIPGILQTEAYATAVIPSTAPTVPTEEKRVVSRRVRFERQRNLLADNDGPVIDAILDESVLHRIFGGPAIMREQLLHLVTLGGSPKVSLRVLPFHAGINTVSGPFVVLEFPDQADADAVYLESAVATSHVLDRADGITKHRQVFDRLSAAAMPPAESLAYIAAFADRYEEQT